MKKDNKGLTLVELIISIGILVIVGSAIAGFMNYGLISFSRTNVEVNLQSEAQLCMSQVMDMAIDTNYAVVQTVNGDGNKLLDMYSYDTIVDPVSNAVSYDYYLDRILFEPTTQKLWYYRYDSIGDPTGVNKKTGDFTFSLPASTGSGELLAENISVFDAWVNPATRKKSKDDTGAEVLAKEDFKVDNKNIFNISVKFEQGSRAYEGSSNSTLRNEVLINKAVLSNGAGGPGGGPGTPTGTVNSVDVTPAVAITKRGGAIAFHSAVRGTGSLNQEVTWRIEGNGSANTVISNGVVNVAADESASSIDVYATSVQDNTKEGSATLFIKEVTAVNASFESTSFRQNSTVVATASVTGYNLDAVDDQKVTWRVTEGANYVSQFYNTFRIALSAPVGTVVTLVATSVVDPTISSAPISFTVEPYDNSAAPEEDSKVLVVTSPVQIKRDGTGTFIAKADAEISKNMHLEWDVKVIDQTTGNNCKVGSVFSFKADGAKCIVNVFKALDFDDEAVVHATCYLVPNGKSVQGMSEEERNKLVGREGLSPVDKVSLAFGKDSVAENLSDIRLSKPIYYTQPYDTKYYYVLKGIENASVSWKGQDDWMHISMSSSKGEIKISSKSRSVDTKGATTTATAYIGSKKLDNKIVAAAAPSNIPPLPSLAWGKDPYIVYLPLPSEKDFPFRTTDEIAKVTRDAGNGYDISYWDKNGGKMIFPDYQNIYASFIYYPKLTAEGGKDTWYVCFIENGNVNYSAGMYKCYSDSETWIKAQ